MLTAEFKLEDALQVWKEEGIAEGIEKGFEEGIQKGIAREQEIARNFLANGVSVEIVAKSTGLSREQIEKL
jgi:predicted transposase/invertase (TIGR01784 family)